MRLHPCGDFLLAFPDDHRLPEIQRVDVLYDRGWKHALRSIGSARPRSTIIDVGANVGDTAAFIRSHTKNPILCVEGGDDFIPYLRHNVDIIGKDIRVIEDFVAPQADFKASYTSETGTGRLVPDTNADFSSVSLSDVLRAARDLGDGGIALFKSDTDGMDAILISEALDLCPNTPLFFECDYRLTQTADGKDIWSGIFGDLKNRKSSMIVFDNHGLPMMCMDCVDVDIINDIQGWIHCQHQLHSVRTHYIDLVVFPESLNEAYRHTCNLLRNQLLAPYKY